VQLLIVRLWAMAVNEVIRKTRCQFSQALVTTRKMPHNSQRRCSTLKDFREADLMRRIVLLAVVLLLGGVVLSSEAQNPAKRDDAELKAMAQIQKLGGLVLELAQNDPHLEVSYLQKEAKFGDEFLTPLKNLKGLVHLNLRGQDVTDAQLVHLKDITTLTRLHLENTKITDKGLEQLKGLVNLEYLNLYGTAITDAGLAHLEGMKKLKDIYLWQTKVTDAGVAKLKKALPQVEIVRGIDLTKPIEEKKAEPAKKDEKKADPKKTEPKKDEKKAEPAKKDEKKAEPKKDEKKADPKKDEKKEEKK
jgi:hypothetical protein